MSKRAEEAAAAFHNQALLEAQKYAQSYGGGISQEIAYGRGLKTGFIEGYEQAKKDIISLVESRLSELLGDAQPTPILRYELQDLIKKIKEENNG